MKEIILAGAKWCAPCKAVQMQGVSFKGVIGGLIMDYLNDLRIPKAMFHLWKNDD